MTGENKKPEILALNPFGKVPILVEGDFVLYESRAIARYINDTRGGKLIPSDPKKRAIMEQWVSLEEGTLSPLLGTIVRHRYYGLKFGREPDEESVRTAIKESAKGLDVMNDHLAKNEYLAGDQFTLADAFFMPNMALLMRTSESSLIGRRQHLAMWWQRVSARDAWKKTDALNVLEHKEHEQKA